MKSLSNERLVECQACAGKQFAACPSGVRACCEPEAVRSLACDREGVASTV